MIVKELLSECRHLAGAVSWKQVLRRMVEVHGMSDARASSEAEHDSTTASSLLITNPRSVEFIPRKDPTVLCGSAANVEEDFEQTSSIVDGSKLP